MGWEVVDCTHLAQDREQWRTLVNTVVNLRVPQKGAGVGISWLAEWLLTFSRTLLHGVGCNCNRSCFLFINNLPFSTPLTCQFLSFLFLCDPNTSVWFNLMLVKRIYKYRKKTSHKPQNIYGVCFIKNVSNHSTETSRASSMPASLIRLSPNHGNS